MIDRSGGTAKVGVPLIALAEWKVKAWPADKLPAHLKNIPAVKPGSQRACVTKLRLGVNVDHVATVRQARGSRQSRSGARGHCGAGRGADGITAHLREDRRHISDDDIARLSEALKIPLNLEMARHR